MFQTDNKILSVIFWSDKNFLYIQGKYIVSRVSIYTITIFYLLIDH